jgi:hypothetical protein
MPPTVVETTGRPEAIASMITHGRFSNRLGSTKTSEPRICSATSLFFRAPRNAIAPDTGEAATRRS